MADKSPIEWTDATWNPVRARIRAHGVGPVTHVGWHCEKVSAGCDNCYAQGINMRLGTKRPFKPGHLAPRGEVEVLLDDRMLTAPLRWKKPRRIFVNSMTDTFGPFVTDEMLDRIFAVMALCPQHTFQVLTKRPQRMRDYLSDPNVCGIGQWAYSMLPASADPADHLSAFGDPEEPNITPKTWPLPNVWLGTSVEDQITADARIPHLLATPAAVRFVSAEPLLGPVDLEPWLDWPDGGIELPDDRFFGCADCETDSGPRCRCPRDRSYYHVEEGPRDSTGCPEFVHAERVTLDLVIVGGESGPHARPMNPDWPRALRDQCVAAGVSFFFKQWGEWVSVSEVEGPGEHHRFPDGRTVRRTGKKRAGRQLDGRTWDEMPGARRA